MSLPKRLALAAALLLLLVMVLGGIWLYRSLSHVPPFYGEALSASPVELRESSREMLRRTAALTNDVKRTGKWQALFTDDQINGWLAVDVPKNHPELLPANVLDPRVQISPERFLAGARIEQAISGVVSVELAVRLTHENVLAVRIHKLRVGDVPWALDQIVEQVAAAAAEWGVHVEQTQTDGDPVLLLTLPTKFDHREVVLEHLELRDGEVFVSGRTQ